ncbi:aminoglycoside phosphotransferase family protein, partial [bacterium]|nr:aminoglycoside phosphotransferase family protein [bacterium]
PSLNYWKKILPVYARFQQALIPHRQELLDIGVKDRSLSVLPGLVKKLAEDPKALCIGQPDGLSPADFEAFISVLPKLQSLCATLAKVGIPETLQHDDFHDGNIFVDQAGFKFFDWAESFIAHPFFSLVVTLRSIAYRFDLEENSPEIRELTALYLKEWLDYAPHGRLQEAFDLALIVGRINRALTWHMVVTSLPEPYRSKEADAVPGWIQLFLEKIIPCV